MSEGVKAKIIRVLREQSGRPTLPEGAIGWVKPGVPLWPHDEEDPQAQRGREWSEVRGKKYPK